MKSIFYFFMIFPMICFCSQHYPYRSGVETAKKDILEHIDSKIHETYKLFLTSDTDDFFFETSGKLDIYYQLKFHIETEFKKDIWYHPIVFTYP